MTSKMESILRAAIQAISGEIYNSEENSAFIEMLLHVKLRHRSYFLSSEMVKTDIWPLVRNSVDDKLLDITMKMSQAFEMEIRMEGLYEDYLNALINALSYSTDCDAEGIDKDTASKLGKMVNIDRLLTINKPVAFVLFCSMFMKRLGFQPVPEYPNANKKG